MRLCDVCRTESNSLIELNDQFRTDKWREVCRPCLDDANAQIQEVRESYREAKVKAETESVHFLFELRSI